MQPCKNCTRKPDQSASVSETARCSMQFDGCCENVTRPFHNASSVRIVRSRSASFGLQKITADGDKCCIFWSDAEFEDFPAMRAKARAKRQHGLSGFARRDFLRRQTRGFHGLFRNDKAHKSQVLLHFRGGVSLVREKMGFDAIVIGTTSWRNPDRLMFRARKI